MEEFLAKLAEIKDKARESQVSGMAGQQIHLLAGAVIGLCDLMESQVSHKVEYVDSKNATAQSRDRGLAGSLEPFVIHVPVPEGDHEKQAEPGALIKDGTEPEPAA